MGDLIPNEMAMAIPNRASSKALPREIQRGQIPRINAIPKNNSPAVAAQARNGIVAGGMKEFTLAVYWMKPSKFP